MSHALVLLSGGVDSAACLYWASAKGHRLIALSFDYYLRPPRERAAVAALAQRVSAEVIEVAVPFMKEASDLGNDSLSLTAGMAVAEGYMPARNLVFYSIAAHFAEARGIGLIVGGHLKADAEAFPDASPRFFAALEQLIVAGRPAAGRTPLKLVFPFADASKAQLLRAAEQLGVPFELTWSCYTNATFACGRCVSCRERVAAFAEIGLPDPSFASPRD